VKFAKINSEFFKQNILVKGATEIVVVIVYLNQLKLNL